MGADRASPSRKNGYAPFAVQATAIPKAQKNLLGISAAPLKKLPAVGIEPTLREKRDFESRASANSATPAWTLKLKRPVTGRNPENAACHSRSADAHFCRGAAPIPVWMGKNAIYI
jgi:hypothetical protein